MIAAWIAACGQEQTDGDGRTAPDPDPADSGAAVESVPPPGDTAGTPTEPPGPPDPYLEPGPFGVTSREAVATTTSCPSMEATAYEPVGGSSAAVIVLAHGFAGRRRDLEGWGEHLASWGLSALVPQLCHASPFDADHRQNGLDLVAAAAELAPGRQPFYVGYSAGGLAALVAASADPGAGGHLGLDTVDASGLAEPALAALVVPAADLWSEPSACNTRNNAVPLYDAAGVETLAVPGADHCDWTRPAVASCSFLCAEGPDDPSIRETITTLGTSWLLWRAALDDDAARWWVGDGRALLESDGRIRP